MSGGWFVFQTNKDAFPNMVGSLNNIFVIYVNTLLSFVLLQKSDEKLQVHTEYFRAKCEK